MRCGSRTETASRAKSSPWTAAPWFSKRPTPETSPSKDNSFAAGRWALKFDHFLLPKSLQYFLYHTGLQSLEDSDDLILFTQTGFRIPFYKNLNITAQVNWEYDKNPSFGKKESDYTYLLTLGYLWSN